MALSRKKLVTGLATAVPVILAGMSAMAKFAGAPEVVDKLTKSGVGPYIGLLGAMEAGFALLFVFPQTMKLGVLLLTAYFAGAIATDLSHNSPIMAPVVILAVIWVAAFIRDPSVFLRTPAAAE